MLNPKSNFGDACNSKVEVSGSGAVDRGLVMRIGVALRISILRLSTPTSPTASRHGSSDHPEINE
jgi:hypothetical protein